VCARQQDECPDTPSDCVASCEDGRRRAEDAGCPDAHDELTACLHGADDICNACDVETSAFLQCTCPDGACLTEEGCAFSATTGSASGSCIVIAVCGEATLSLDCRGEDEPCRCLDEDGNETATVPYQVAFCSEDVAAQGAAAQAACGW
jgi:hypothetical protein